MHQGRRLYAAAQRYLGSLGAHNAGRLVLSLFFKAIVGIERIFHFDTVDDIGLAIVTGGTKRVISRSHLGALVRRVWMPGLRRLMRATTAPLATASWHWVSIDEHAIARFTRKFRIPKGFHTIRNKHMKVEKLIYCFHVATRTLISLVAAGGNASLARAVKALSSSLRRRARGAPIHLILDAGAALNHQALLQIALQPNQVTLVRVPRRAAYQKAWKALPAQAWTYLEEPGPYKGAKPKALAIAQTRTRVAAKGGFPMADVRTIVIREAAARGKERWHALWVFGDEQTAPYDLVKEFRSRQHHEQTYRLMLHDLFLDAAPCGYNKKTQPHRPGFHHNALTLYGWITALAANALLGLSLTLPERFHRAHPRTLRRYFLHTPAALYLGPDTLIVLLQPKRLLALWRVLIRGANRRHTRIPWLGNRRLILSLDPPKHIRTAGISK